MSQANRPTEQRTSETLAGQLRAFASEALPMPWTFSRQTAIQMTLREAADEIESLRSKYQRAVNGLRDIAAMSRKLGSETAAHTLAMLGEPRDD